MMTATKKTSLLILGLTLRLGCATLFEAAGGRGIRAKPIHPDHVLPARHWKNDKHQNFVKNRPGARTEEPPSLSPTDDEPPSPTPSPNEPEPPATDEEDTEPKTGGGALIPGLIQTNDQPMFETLVPNALDPSFFFSFNENNFVGVAACKDTNHETGLVDDQNQPLKTPIYGYRQRFSDSCTWPGRTFEIQANVKYYVRWWNEIPIEEDYLITSLDGESVVDTSIHWAYNLPGYESFSISTDGVPIVVHHHGAPNVDWSDGDSEAFFTPNFEIKGPRWKKEVYLYTEEVAGSQWYHDHALGITRLNVYAGMAGFFFTRDDVDTGKPDNPLRLPAFPYEAAFAIQDRMFKEDGSLFYPAFPGDPAYQDFIIDQGAELPSDVFPNGGPTALAEYFGDVIVVNGKIWPKMEVEPRKYRLRLLNGCDSRFLIVQFAEVSLGVTEVAEDAEPLDFHIIGTDEGLAWDATTTDTLVIELGSRYDVVFDFRPYDGKRIVMRNIGLDEPFGGYFDSVPTPKSGTTYSRTDRIMAFDVVTALDDSVADDFDPTIINGSPFTEEILAAEPTNTRRLGLFEGSDSYGRILPILGTVDPATDCDGNPVYWPDTELYQEVGLAGRQMEGTMPWHSPTTEHVQGKSAIEVWEYWNFSEDAHPMHMHLGTFVIEGRYQIIWDSNTSEESRVLDDPDLAIGDGTFVLNQPVVMHDGSIGQGTRVMNPTKGERISTPPGYFETGLKDTAITPPGEITVIKAYFERAGNYSWHCHILSHEDTVMMRRYTVCDGDK